MIRPRSKERGLRRAVLIAGDLAIGCGALYAGAAVRRNTFELDPPIVALFGLSLVAALGLTGFYRDRVTPRTRPSLVAAMVIQAALVAMAAVALVEPMPRTIVLAVPVVELIAVPLWRRILRLLAPIRPRETILLGDAHDLEQALAGLRSAGDRRIAVAGQLPARLDVLADPAHRARLHDAEEVICVSPEIDPRVRLELLRVRGPCGFLMLASHADALFGSKMLGWIGDQPLIEVAVSCGYGFSAALKRAIDIGGSAILIVLSAPLWLLAAVAIWLEDRGPIVIRQQRVGVGGAPYGMWKFRSMRGPLITRVGSWLRPYHVDELPQLLNVLTGDMSLVGPRPERPELVAEILREVPDFDLRSLIRPGIAGLAQVSSEYDTRPEVKLRYDVMYMCGWSPWLDIRLMLRAVSSSLAGTGR